MKSPLISIIIVNWNGGDVFKNCLKSLSKLNYPNWELIVFDNGSKDGSGTERFIKSNFNNKNAKLKIVRSRVNKGFAPANNLAFKKTEGKYILLLNNDTIVPPAFLTKLVKKAESDSEIGVLQPKILIMDDPELLDNAGSFLTRTGFLQHWGFMKKDSREFSKEREIFSAKGACMLVRTSVINKVGLFDQDFISYFEESDFCWRVWLAGWKVLYSPVTQIHHKVGFTSKRLNQHKVTLISTRNRISSLYKNLSRKNLLFILFPHISFLIILGFYYLFTLQPSKAWMIWGAILWNFRHFPALVKKRAEVQKIRTASDKKLFKIIMQKTDIKEMLSHFASIEENFKK